MNVQPSLCRSLASPVWIVTLNSLQIVASLPGLAPTLSSFLPAAPSPECFGPNSTTLWHLRAFLHALFSGRNFLFSSCQLLTSLLLFKIQQGAVGKMGCRLQWAELEILLYSWGCVGSATSCFTSGSLSLFVKRQQRCYLRVLSLKYCTRCLAKVIKVVYLAQLCLPFFYF